MKIMNKKLMKFIAKKFYIIYIMKINIMPSALTTASQLGPPHKEGIGKTLIVQKYFCSLDRNNLIIRMPYVI